MMADSLSRHSDFTAFHEQPGAQQRYFFSCALVLEGIIHRHHSMAFGVFIEASGLRWLVSK